MASRQDYFWSRFIMIEDLSFVSGTVLHQRKIEYPNRSSWHSSQCPYLGVVVFMFDSFATCEKMLDLLIPMRSCVRSSAGTLQGRIRKRANATVIYS